MHTRNFLRTEAVPDRSQVINAYAESARCKYDALDHVGDQLDGMPEELVVSITKWYMTTAKFMTVVDDIVAGEVAL